MDGFEGVGPYRIVRPLGHGGMGDVFLAVREGDGFSTTVALKVIRRGIDTDRVLERDSARSAGSCPSFGTRTSPPSSTGARRRTGARTS